MRKTGIIYTLIGLLLSISGCAQKIEQPKIVEEIKTVDEVAFLVAVRFINAYVANCNKMEQAVDLRSWVDSSRDVTSSFKNALHRIVDDAIKHDPELGLESDPIFDAQDYPEEGFRMIGYDPRTGVVTVQGKKWQDFKLYLRIIKVNGDWLVDGVGVVNMSLETQVHR